MNKRILLGLFISVSLIFTFTYVFAEELNVMDNPENMVNSAANSIRNGVNDVTGATRNALTDTNVNTNANTGNWFKDEGDKLGNNLNNVTGGVVGTNNNNYNASRTAIAGTDQDNTLFGMTGTAWTWLILGIAGIIIIGLVWYYSMQLTSHRYED